MPTTLLSVANPRTSNQTPIVSEAPAIRTSRFGVRSASELHRRVEETGNTKYLIDGFIPQQSLTLAVGDSGLGKSPLLYQALMCVSAGLPFLGRSVVQGRTLYMDFENGQNDVDGIVGQLAEFLSLKDVPDNFQLWNFNDTTEYFVKNGNYMIEDLVEEQKPSAIVIDPLNALFPGIERDSTNATEAYQTLRKMMSEHHCSVIGVHHIRKTESGTVSQSLEAANVRDWFQQARGARALINGSDIRLGIDKAVNGVDLILRGFGRVKGEVGPIYISRMYGDDGEPAGYQQLIGAELLSDIYRETFCMLPDEFRFTEAKRIHGKGDESTKTFLKKCESAGLLSQPQKRGPYRKIPLRVTLPLAA